MAVLFKIVVLAILAYYVLQASRRLYRAMLEDPRAGQGQFPPGSSPGTHAEEPGAPGGVAGRPARPRRAKSGPDIEDAKWIDLE